MPTAAKVPAPGAPGRTRTYLAAAAIAAGALLAYHATFQVPFVYDDIAAIPGNPSLHHLGSALLSAPGETTVGGRPIANLSLALNFGFGGTAVGGYHAFNLGVHLLAGLTLFGLARRTLRKASGGLERNAFPLALAIALLWTVHPLATESVTYVVQRVESLMGLFYLLTLYCFSRSQDSARPAWWQAGAVFACLLGMATKEVMVTAPVLVLLYDRAFAAGSFRQAWRRRRGFYLALASTWMLLAVLVFTTGGNRRGAAGFDIGISPPAYWLTQVEAVARYLGLAVWPSPLVFEYGAFRAHGLGELLPYSLVVLPLAAAAIVALARRPQLGFLAFGFFALLAPSSVVPVATQTMAEHRMYLPLAAVVAAAVIGIYRVAKRAAWPLLVAAGLSLLVLTLRRNAVYASDLALWRDTVAKRPDNANARNNLGLALFRVGDAPGAIREYRAALALEPRYPGVLNNLGNALEDQGDSAAAIAAYTRALELEPAYAAAHFDLAKALDRAGRPAEAVGHFQAAVSSAPGATDARLGLADALAHAGRTDEAVDQYAEVLRVDPARAAAHNGRGVALVQSGKFDEAAQEYEAALRLQPDLAEAHNNLGVLLCRAGKVPEGIAQLREALRLNPGYAAAHFDLGNALAQSGEAPEAIEHFEAALRIDPTMAAASNNLGMTLCRTGRVSEGLQRIEAALRLQPDFVPAHFTRGMALLQLGRRAEAVREFETVLQLHPQDPSATRMLEMIRTSP